MIKELFRKTKKVVPVVLLFTLLVTTFWGLKIDASADEVEGEGEVGVVEESETVVDEGETFTGGSASVTIAGDGKSSEELLAEYIDAKVNEVQGIDNAYSATTLAGSKLDGNNRRAYEAGKIMAAAVAAGERSDVTFAIDVENPHFVTYTGDFSSLLEGNGVDLGSIMNAIFSDCPYDRYWMGLGISVSVKGGDYEQSGNQVKINKFTFIISPNYDYAKSQTEADTAKTSAVKATISKVNDILDTAKSKDDRGKVTYYRDQIMDLNTYNDDALKLPESQYGNPWQLVWVFDGDPSTNVVCEGYSKAFAYLCEKTSFSDSAIYAFVVTGDLVYNGQGGGHMWNVLHWSDGVNYLVDVTNCDGGNPVDDLFMAVPKSGTVEAGYIFTCGKAELGFVYDDFTKSTYSNSELTIGGTPGESALENIFVEYETICNSNEASKFVVKRQGGSSSTQFKLDAVKDSTGKTILGPIGYQASNEFTVVFPAEGTYTLTFSAKDGDKEISGKTITVVVRKGDGEAQKKLLAEFVSRFYTRVLGRTTVSDEEINYYVNALIAREKTGADVAEGFVMSDEFANRNLSDADFVKVMYSTFFDREPAQDEISYWTGFLTEGYSRRYVLAGFVNSPEFATLCANYGIDPGKIVANENPSKPDPEPTPTPDPEPTPTPDPEPTPEPTPTPDPTPDPEPTPVNPTVPAQPGIKLDPTNVDPAKINAFVDRLYKTLFGWSDDAGVAYWSNTILNGKDVNGNSVNPASIARIVFIESDEYAAKNKTNTEFVTDLYRAILGREPEAEGLQYWVDKIEKEGYTKQQVIDIGFGCSNEFKGILKSFGYEITE